MSFFFNCCEIFTSEAHEGFFNLKKIVCFVNMYVGHGCVIVLANLETRIFALR